MQEKTLHDLQTAKEIASKELEQELDKIVDLRTKIQEVTKQVKETDELKRRLEFEICTSPAVTN